MEGQRAVSIKARLIEELLLGGEALAMEKIYQIILKMYFSIRREEKISTSTGKKFDQPLV